MENLERVKNRYKFASVNNIICAEVQSSEQLQN